MTVYGYYANMSVEMKDYLVKECSPDHTTEQRGQQHTVVPGTSNKIALEIVDIENGKVSCKFFSEGMCQDGEKICWVNYYDMYTTVVPEENN